MMEGNYSAKDILNVATTLGFNLLRYGAEVYRVEETISRICTAYGFCDTHIFAIGSNITATVVDGETTITETRRIKSRDLNLDKVDKLNHLSREVCENTPSPFEIRKQIAEIKKAPIYPLGVMVLCDAIISGCFTLFFGGDIYEAVIAFFAGATARASWAITSKFGGGQYYKIMISSFIVAFIANIFQNISIIISADLIIIGSIMTLVPGISVTNSLRDFFAGDTVTGLITFAESILIAVSIAIGVAVAMVLV